MQPGLGRPERDPDGHRHVRQRQPQEEVENDDRPMVGAEARERPLDLVAIDDERTEVTDRDVGRGCQFDLDHPTAPTPQDAEAGTHGDTVDPGVERVRVAQPGQVPPGTDECLLDRVARELRVVEDQSGCCVQPRDALEDELTEGVMIASTCPFD